MNSETANQINQSLLCVFNIIQLTSINFCLGKFQPDLGFPNKLPGLGQLLLLQRHSSGFEGTHEA